MTERITVTGNIGRAPRRKATSKGDVVAFSLAHDTRVQGEDGAWKDGETLWYEVATWDRLADSAEGALRAGQRIIVQGSLHERRWTGDDGVERLSRDLRANVIGHDISQRAGARASAAPHRTEAPVEAPAATALDPVPRVAAAHEGGDRSPSPVAVAQEPTPAGWSTLCAAEEETPF